MDELLLMRKDDVAFGIYMGEWVEKVAGVGSWGKKKYSVMPSVGRPKDADGLPLVSVTDEALTLFFYENYIDKWKLMAVDDMAGRKSPKREGKYTETKSGNCLFGGWSLEGKRRFNEICAMVVADRAGPHAAEAEKRFLDGMRTSPKGIKTLGRPQPRNRNTDQPEEVVDAFCDDSDEE